MTLITLMRKIAPYVRPYKWLVVATLLLTLIGSLIAQVNAIVLDRTVDAINALIVPEGFEWSKAANILTIISIVLCWQPSYDMPRTTMVNACASSSAKTSRKPWWTRFSATVWHSSRVPAMRQDVCKPALTKAWVPSHPPYRMSSSTSFPC